MSKGAKRLSNVSIESHLTRVSVTCQRIYNLIMITRVILTVVKNTVDMLVNVDEQLNFTAI